MTVEQPIARAARRTVTGIVLLDKPVGMSSNRALQRVKGLFRARKAGHTGSLDPAASGLLPICLGEATKVCGWLLDADKTYEVEATFGEQYSTGDLEGKVVQTGPVPKLNDAEFRANLQKFTGEQEQIPPMYSALKHEGRRLYSIARAGKQVERRPRRIRIRQIDRVRLHGATLAFRVRCSKGTYIRTLVEDIASSLGTVAYTSALRRVQVGPFSAAEMHTLDELEAMAERLDACLIAADAALADWPAVRLAAAETHGFRAGRGVRIEDGVNSPGAVRVYGPELRFIGIGEALATGVVVPRRVFSTAKIS